MPTGLTIGHVKALAGTRGCIATGRTGGWLMLSNSHVLARSGRAKIGDEVLYPGEFDGGEAPQDVVGRLVNFKKFRTGGRFVNDVDCAVASLNASRLSGVTVEMQGVDDPPGKS